MNPLFTSIKSFIEAFLQAEEIAKNEFKFGNDIEQRNAALQRMNAYCIPDLHNTFGMKPEEPLCEDEATRGEEIKEYWVRPINKISLYEHAIYGQVFLVYLATFTEMDCFAVMKIENDWKIIKKYLFTNDFWRKPTATTYQWYEQQGLESITFETLEQPIAIKRYKSLLIPLEVQKEYESER